MAKTKTEDRPRPIRRLAETVSVILGIASILSFFPRLTVSEPVQMDAFDLFSYQITVVNDGLLPVLSADWALAPRIVQVGKGTSVEGPTKTAQLILPHHAIWTINTSLPQNGLMIYPGSGMTVAGSADYEFQLKRVNTAVGFLAPGDGFTFTTEGLISAPDGAVYDTVDFAVAVSYIPIFPPIPMQSCSNFVIYKDREGKPHWFRKKNQCDRFPWLHNWFESAPKPGPN